MGWLGIGWRPHLPLSVTQQVVQNECRVVTRDVDLMPVVRPRPELEVAALDIVRIAACKTQGFHPVMGAAGVKGSGNEGKVEGGRRKTCASPNQGKQVGETSRVESNGKSDLGGNGSVGGPQRHPHKKHF